MDKEKVRIKQRAFENGKAFIPFLTCGDPDLETTEKPVYAMEEAGADLIEPGISTPKQAHEMAQKSDGAIVGSAIVRLCAAYGRECVPYVKEYVKSMKDAVRE